MCLPVGERVPLTKEPEHEGRVENPLGALLCFVVPSCSDASDSLTPFLAPPGKSTLTKSPGDGKLGRAASAGGQSRHSEWFWQRKTDLEKICTAC